MGGILPDVLERRDSVCEGFGDPVRVILEGLVSGCTFAHDKSSVLSTCSSWKLRVLLSEQQLAAWRAVILEV